MHKTPLICLQKTFNSQLNLRQSLHLSTVVTNSAAADASAERHAVHRIQAANLHQSGQAADGDAL